MVRVWWAIKGVKLTQLNTPLRFEWVRVFSLVCLQLPLQELMLLRGLWCCCCACCCCCGGGCMFNHNWQHLHHCGTAKIRETSQRCGNVSPNDEMTIHPCLLGGEIPTPPKLPIIFGLCKYVRQLIFGFRMWFQKRDNGLRGFDSVKGAQLW